MLLKNMWYVAAESSEVAVDKPHKVRVLGQSFVLFRDRAGKVSCLSDICVHRGASLSQAKRMINGCIECPYHGWQFNGQGDCVKIPAQGDKPVSSKVRIDAYPVQERYGWIWVFFGELPEAERPPIPSFAEYGDTKHWRAVRGEYRWNADAGRVVENGLDFAHAPYVHRGFMGDPDRGEIDEIVVSAGEWEASAAHHYQPPPARGIWKYFQGKRDGVTARTGFHISGALMRLDLQISKKWKLVIFDVNTPVDEHTTLTRWICVRNFFLGSWADGDTRRRVIEIFDQDREVLEQVKPIELPYDLSEEYSVQSDSLAITYRRLRKKLIDRGWAVDFKRLRSEYEGRAVVIPSPRRKDPLDRTRWILGEVPTIAPDPEREEQAEDGEDKRVAE